MSEVSKWFSFFILILSSFLLKVYQPNQVSWTIVPLSFSWEELLQNWNDLLLEHLVKLTSKKYPDLMFPVWKKKTLSYKFIFFNNYGTICTCYSPCVSFFKLHFPKCILLHLKSNILTKSFLVFSIWSLLISVVMSPFSPNIYNLYLLSLFLE